MTQHSPPDNYAPTFQTGPLRSVIYEAKVEAIANHLDRTCRSRILLPAGRWPIVRAASAGDESAINDSGLRPLLPPHNLSARRTATDVRTIALYSATKLHGATNLRACSHLRAPSDVCTGNDRSTSRLCTRPTASALSRELFAANHLRSADDHASANDYRASSGLHGAARRLRLTASRRPGNCSTSFRSICLQFDTLPVRRCSPSPSRHSRSRRG